MSYHFCDKHFLEEFYGWGPQKCEYMVPPHCLFTFSPVDTHLLSTVNKSEAINILINGRSYLIRISDQMVGPHRK